MSDFLKLKKRREFLRVAQKGERVVTTSLIMQAAHSLSKEQVEPKFGFTTTKKLGHAVVRNKARRRLRAVVREIYKNHACKNTEYVLIGRYSTAECDFLNLLKDLKYAFKKSHKLLYGDNYEANDVETDNHSN